MPITVIDTLAPKTPTFPVVADTNVQGGFQVCATTAARDAIPLNNQKVGMLVYVSGNSTYYQLTATGTPGTYALANLGGSANLTGDVTGNISANTVASISGSGGNIPFNATIIGNQGSSNPVSFGVQAITLSADANYVLTAAQLVNPFLRFASSLSLTATRTITLPNSNGALYYVYNNTNGGQALLFKASTGTGVTVANGLKTAIYFDGTNYVVSNILVGGDLKSNSNIAQTVVGIQGYPVSSTVPGNDGYALVSLGGQYVPTGVAPVLNVRSFGAVGNGIADDTAAIQAAINAASAVNGICYIPSGRYLISSTLNVPAHVNIQGDTSNYIGPAGLAGGCWGTILVWNTTITTGTMMQIVPPSTIVSNMPGFPNTDIRFFHHRDFILCGNFTACTTTLTGGALSLPTGTIPCVSTAAYPSSGQLNIQTTTGLQTITYTHTSPTSFLGCTGGTGTTTNNDLGLVNSVVGLRIAGLDPYAVSGGIFDQIHVVEFHIGVFWGDVASHTFECDFIQWNKCRFAYCDGYQVYMTSANAGDSTLFNACSFDANFAVPFLANANGLWAEYYGYLKMLNCTGSNLDRFVLLQAGDTFIMENNQVEGCNWFLDIYAGAGDNAIALNSNTINCGLRAGAFGEVICRIVATGNWCQLANFAWESANIAANIPGVQLLSAGIRWIGFGNKFDPPIAGVPWLTIANGSTFYENDVPHAGGLYNNEFYAQGLITWKPDTMYSPYVSGIGQVNEYSGFAVGEVCTQSGFKAPSWTALTAFGFGSFVTSVPNDGYVFEVTTPVFTIAENAPVGEGAPVNLPQSTIYVNQTVGFPSSGTFYILTLNNGFQAINYTGKTAGSFPTSNATFTGCTGGTGEIYFTSVVTLESGSTQPAWNQTIGATTNDGGLVWTCAGLSSVCELFGPPGQMRADSLPAQSCIQGTQVFRHEVTAGEALGWVAIRNTAGGITDDWRSFGITWGGTDGQTPGAFVYPVSGSAIDESSFSYTDGYVDVGTGTTYNMTYTDAANPSLSFGGSPSGTCTITFPTLPDTGEAWFRIFNNTTQTLIFTSGAGITSSLLPDCGGAVLVSTAGEFVLPVDTINQVISSPTNSTALSFFGATPIIQPNRVGSLTDSTGGSAGSTIAAMTGTYSGDYVNLNNDLASLTAKINALELIIHNYGLSK